MTDMGRVEVDGFEPFAMVPLWLADRPDLTDRGLALWVHLWRFADRDSFECWPSRRTLADLMACSTNTVDRAIRNLEEIGALTVSERFDSGGQRSNVYTLHWSRVGTPLPTDGDGGSRTGGAGPLPTDGEQNKSQNEPEPVEQEVARVPAVNRSRNDIWDTLVGIFGEPTRSQRSAYGRICASLKEAGATPEEIRRRSERIVRTWGPEKLTVYSLEKHWPRFADGAVGSLTEEKVRAHLDEEQWRALEEQERSKITW